MFAALMTGHHFSMSAFCSAARASGVSLLNRKNLLPHIGKSLACLRVAQGFNDGGIELRNDVLRGTRGRPEAMPKRHVQPRYSCLVDGGNVVSPRPVVLGQNCIGLDVATANLGQQIRRLEARQVYLA